MAAEVRALLRDILERRPDAVGLAMAQRAKFEGWLKVELAACLASQERFDDVRLEDQYAQGRRADISFVADDIRWFVELKTPNTNWRATGIESKTRPITLNISGVIGDINALSRRSPSSRALAIFVIFPIPRRIWTLERRKLAYHLKRIEQEASLPDGSVENSGEFVVLGEDVELAIYVVEVA